MDREIAVIHGGNIFDKQLAEQIAQRIINDGTIPVNAYFASEFYTNLHTRGVHLSGGLQCDKDNISLMFDGCFAVWGDDSVGTGLAVNYLLNEDGNYWLMEIHECMFSERIPSARSIWTKRYWR